jgi:hypothetical protein
MEVLCPTETSADFRRTTSQKTELFLVDINFAVISIEAWHLVVLITSEPSVPGIKVLQKQSQVLNATYAAVTSSELHISCPSIIEGMKVV